MGGSFDWNAPLWTGGPVPEPHARSHAGRRWIAALCLVALFLSSGGIGTTNATESAGLFPVPVGGRYGYIDRDGRMVIQPQFTDAEPFAGGLALVSLRAGSWGYVDQSGKLVFESALGGR